MIHHSTIIIIIVIAGNSRNFAPLHCGSKKKKTGGAPKAQAANGGHANAISSVLQELFVANAYRELLPLLSQKSYTDRKSITLATSITK